MGRHAAPELEWADYEADPAAYTHVPIEEIPTEPVAVKTRSVVPVLVMFFGAVLAGALLVALVQRWPGHIGYTAGAMLVGLVVVPYLSSMLGMLLLHWREL